MRPSGQSLFTLSFLRREFPRSGKLWVLGAIICVLFIASSIAGTGENQQTAAAASVTSQEFANTKPGVEYVGDEACRNCHSSIYDSFKQTGMGRSTSVPSAEELREAAKPITFISNDVNRAYKIYTRDGKIVHEETGLDASGRPTFSESHEIAFTVGTGDMGKSYLVFKGDSLFVSPISYYTRIHGYDLSPGYNQKVFQGFERRVVDLCVDCHSGRPQFVPGSHDRFQQPPFRFLTVGCERCHGPGAIHVAMRTMQPYFEGAIDPSIVNPKKVRADMRDDICLQCHQAGDARVLQPGKDYLDFRPGTPLGDTVAIFSVPQAIKGNHFVLLDQFEQLKLSRCWIASKGNLGCISCHNPHVQRYGNDAVDFYRSRCLTCHNNSSCTAARAARQATTPADNCIACHMPQKASEKIDHTSITDHRILRTQSEIPAGLNGNESLSLDLILDTKPSHGGETQNLRNLALAYAQVGARYAEYDETALQVLESAAHTFPADAEVQATYGKALLMTHTRQPEVAVQALEKAIDAGSKSAEARALLARVRLHQGQEAAAVDLYKEAIQLDPYFEAAYIDLARVYSTLGDRQRALQTLDKALQLDPGNDAARMEQQRIATTPDENK